LRFWWVNQNQTYRHEIEGGYLWSPKRNRNGARNPFYESMLEVAPGDVVVSFIWESKVRDPFSKCISTGQLRSRDLDGDPECRLPIANQYVSRARPD